jgi:predicted HD phosphohydrolase
VALTVSDICLLFARKGGRLYEGEPVTQLEHALQSAARAEAASASAALVCASTRSAICARRGPTITTRCRRIRSAA